MTAQLSVYALGQAAILLDGQPVTELSSRTAEALLIYLMCQKRPLSRQVLANFLWDDRSPQRAATNLRTLLTMLRKPLGEFLTITRQSVVFNHHKANYWLDVAQLERELAAMNTMLQSPAPLPGEAVGRLRAALDLYQGHFLEGFYLSESRGFEEWTLLIQERLRRLVSTGLRRLVTHFLENGDYPAGIHYAGRLLAVDPYNEEAHRQMMWLLVRSGQRNAALEQFYTCHRLLNEELSVEPASMTTAVFERIRAFSFPPPCRLPPSPTPFVGREAELAEIWQHLAASHCRLLTILGPGGIGKTRLALEAVQRFYQQWPGRFLDGVYFVPLAGVAHGRFLATTLAEKLGLPSRGQVDPAGQLINYLRQKEMLLLLDNFEHLLGESESDGLELLARILAEAPAVRMLVTSRERLHLHEEWLFDVDGLSYPAPGQAVSQVAWSCDAVQLFLQNAGRVRRAFSPSAADLHAIVRVCQLLQGMPLGLELASAWVRQYTCLEIAAQIGNDLDFLATSYWNAPARHRSLRAVFEHSWHLLTAAEQAAIRRLSIFHGRISVGAAREIANVSAATLAALANKSLLRQTDRADHFEMHELLKQYAAEKLAEEPATERQLRNNFGRYYAAFLARQAARLKGKGQQKALQAISNQLENVQAAWNDAVARRKRPELAQMLEAVHWFYWQRGYLQQGLEILAQAAAELAAERRPNDALLAGVQSRQADFYTWTSEYETARSLLEAAIPTLRQAEAGADLGWALDTLGHVAYGQGYFAEARQYFQEALALFRCMDEQPGMAQSLTGLANVLCDERADYPAAIPLYEESLAIYREIGDRFGQAKGIINLGSLAHSLGEYEKAGIHYRQGIALCRELGHRQTLAIALNNLGQVAYAQGNYDEALDVLQESVSLRRELSDRRGLTFSLMSLGNLAGRMGNYRQAKQRYDEALRISLTLSSVATLADVLVGLADLLIRSGHVVWAAELAGIVLHYGPHGQEINNKAQEILARLEAEAGAEIVASGRRRAGATTLPAAVDDVLRWSLE